MNSKIILEKFFGYTEFRPAQEEIISHILRGESVLTILPTGGGKSLCYQIPALMSPGFSIVISPLIALMKDQVDSINKIEKVAAFINSSLDPREADKVFQNLAGGSLKILYLSPEKITNRPFAERLKSLKPVNLFIDEVHCISEWGHNFRPSYRKIKEFADFLEIENISSFTATATEDVRKDIIEQLGLKDPKIFVRGFERDNFHLNVLHTPNKKDKIAEILKGNDKPAIIYTATRKSAEEVSEFLRNKRIDCAYYHAGLNPEMRRLIQDDFVSGRVKLIAATNAFGMGIDKSDIRSIFHFNIPGTIENYYQEIGRAGRDGNEASIYLLYDERDRLIQEYFINSSAPSRKQIEDVYKLICDYGKVALGNVSEKEIPIDTNFISLLRTKNVNQGILNSAIKILEESEYLRRRSDFENKHFGQFLLEPNRLNRFAKSFTDAELKDLILLLARDYGSTIFKSKVQINIEKLSELLETNAESVIELLNTISRSGIFTYEHPSHFPAVKLTAARVEANLLQLKLARMKKLTEHSKEKLVKMINYAFAEECRFKYILEYFGQRESSYKCGKCDVCTGKIYTAKVTLEYLEEIILKTIHELKSPVKKKTLIQILTGKADLPSLKKISTFNSCRHFKKEDFENTLNALVRSEMLLYSKETYSLSAHGIDNFIEPDTDVPAFNDNKGYEEDLELFNLLRQARKEASEKFVQQQRLICPDEVLREIVRAKPVTRTELLDVKGVNQRMYNKLGDEFLSILKTFSSSRKISTALKEKKMPANILSVHGLVQKRYSLSDMSSLLKLPESIISTQIETLLEMQPDLEIDFLFEKNELKRIYKKISEGITDLKLLREEFESKISYAKLRIAVAKRRVN
ncbi:MAG: hypothetical protein CVV24_08080 [Ignavibacteriae bacterium HGW-Ignavibacteriae-3]|nr:MAG: hypothetical protein CVV24_08080 [Ignavibacteriae bacterium HGW-Ignavibacteriae-3]